MTCENDVQKVINLYLTELPGDNMHTRYPAYREAVSKYSKSFEAVTTNTNTAVIETLDLATNDLLATIEKLAFTDGFTAGVRHMSGLARLVKAK